MQETTNFDLLFEGLKVGKHYFDYDVGKVFFANLDDIGISNAALCVRLELDKRETMMVAQFAIEGEVTVACDRCTADMQQQLELVEQIVFKFSDEMSEDENLFNIASHEFKVDLAPIVFELILANMPIRNVHPVGECDEEMMKALEKFGVIEYDDEDDDEEFNEEANEEIDDSEQIDPRWSALKNLKNKLD
ncbi:MAG: DUF177 domain-containing protein [Crocinitomicaceae bacterium]|nr:DUF177 domain-containing protein [Crocinitomicaceae bacterium]